MAVRDDGANGVEFLIVTDSDWADEFDEAAKSRRAVRPLGSAGVRRGLAVAVVIVLGGALALRTATSHDADQLAAPPLLQTADTGFAPAWAAAIDSTRQIIAKGQHGDEPAGIRCSSPPGCAIAAEVPASVLGAIRAHLSTARVTQQIDVTAGSRSTVVYRQVRASGIEMTAIVVTVARDDGSRQATSGVKRTPTAMTGSVSYPTGPVGYLVHVEVAGPVGWDPPMDAIWRLAMDSRLLTPG